MLHGAGTLRAFPQILAPRDIRAASSSWNDPHAGLWSCGRFRRAAVESFREADTGGRTQGAKLGALLHLLGSSLTIDHPVTESREELARVLRQQGQLRD